jgi:hypothetical protein
MLRVQPRPNGDSGATSLVTCRRCRLPTLLLVRDRLSEFSQPRTIPGFNNWLRLVLPAGKTNPFRRSPRTPVGDRTIPVSAYADTRPLHLAGSEGKRSLVIQLKYVRARRLNRRRSESFRGQRSPAQRRRKAAAGRHRETATLHRGSPIPAVRPQKRGSATGGGAPPHALIEAPEHATMSLPRELMRGRYGEISADQF